MVCWMSRRSASAGLAAGAFGLRLAGHQRGRGLLYHRVDVDQHRAHIAAAGQVVHGVEQHLFENGPKAACARATQQRLISDALECLAGEVELDVFEIEYLAVLLDERVLRFGEDLDQCVTIETAHRADHRQTADELGDQTELQQVLRQHLGEQLAGVLVSLAADGAVEADALVADAALDDLLEAGERAAADEQDVGGVDLDELLVRMLAPTLRRHRRGRSFEDLQQRLLHTLAADVAGDRGVLALARDLVDLVDVDDAGLGLLDVVVGGLDQLKQDVLDVLADVPGLGEGGGVRDRERDVQHAGECLGEEGLAGAGGPEQHDVGLLQLDRVLVRGAGLHALVVVVDRDRQRLLGVVLADDVAVEELVDLLGLRQLVELDVRALRQLFLDDLVAEVDALVADVDPGACDELLDLFLALAAEGALEQVATVTDACHSVSFTRQRTRGESGDAGLAGPCRCPGMTVPPTSASRDRLLRRTALPF